MKIFIDSANIDEIKKANDLGIIDGVTTNPSLIAKENKDFGKIIQEIIDVINGPINIEIMSTETEDIVKDAIKISELSQNIVAKIPITIGGLKAAKILNTKNIKTNMTLAFSINQVLLASKIGATYVSIFIGRLDDIGYDGIQIIRDAVNVFNLYDIETEIIAASIRHPLHVIECAKAGVHVTTVPFGVIEKMFSHPLTNLGIDKFKQDWESVKIEK